jgi:hypothetical protein
VALGEPLIEVYFFKCRIKRAALARCLGHKGNDKKQEYEVWHQATVYSTGVGSCLMISDKSFKQSNDRHVPRADPLRALGRFVRLPRPVGHVKRTYILRRQDVISDSYSAICPLMGHPNPDDFNGCFLVNNCSSPNGGQRDHFGEHRGSIETIQFVKRFSR